MFDDQCPGATSNTVWKPFQRWRQWNFTSGFSLVDCTEAKLLSKSLKFLGKNKKCLETVRDVQTYPSNKYQSKMFTTNTLQDYSLGIQVVTKSTSDIQSNKHTLYQHWFSWFLLERTAYIILDKFHAPAACIQVTSETHDFKGEVLLGLTVLFQNTLASQHAKLLFPFAKITYTQPPLQ